MKYYFIIPLNLFILWCAFLHKNYIFVYLKLTKNECNVIRLSIYNLLQKHISFQFDHFLLQLKVQKETEGNEKYKSF